MASGPAREPARRPLSPRDGDGRDTAGVYVPSTATRFLRNRASQGPADVVFTYGPRNAMPVVGDWDGA